MVELEWSVSRAWLFHKDREKFLRTFTRLQSSLIEKIGSALHEFGKINDPKLWEHETKESNILSNNTLPQKSRIPQNKSNQRARSSVRIQPTKPVKYYDATRYGNYWKIYFATENNDEERISTSAPLKKTRAEKW